MLIHFYHSTLCPRCARAQKHLTDLLGSAYSSSVEKIDAVKHPIRAWQDGIRMIPALSYDQETISGILLTRDSIKQFLERHKFIESTND